MKFIHLSDLHVGKRVNEFSLLEDQAYILKVIIGIIDDEKPDGVIIAGDVYDKIVPSAEAVQLLDDFFCSLAQMNYPVYVISGNHDSAERLSFGSRLMNLSGIHISPVYDGNIPRFTLSDAYGELNIYMLGFVKPVNVRKFFPDEDIETYTDAVRAALSTVKPDRSQRNILVTHQFVTGAEPCESEEISVGGTDNVDAAVFDDFDYVALGHIHGAQRVSRDTIRYSGTPLKYSFSEVSHKKSVTVVELEEKGNVVIRTVPLVPLHDMREIRGLFSEIISGEKDEDGCKSDYMRIILTDEDDVPDAISRLRLVYPNVMKLDYDNSRTKNSTGSFLAADIKEKSTLQLFSEFFEEQNGLPMSEMQTDFIKDIIRDIWGYDA